MEKPIYEASFPILCRLGQSMVGVEVTDEGISFHLPPAEITDVAGLIALSRAIQEAALKFMEYMEENDGDN